MAVFLWLGYNYLSFNQGAKNNANTVVKLSVFNKRWRISENNKTVLSGIGSASQALAIAKAHGYVLTEISTKQYLRVA